MEYKKILIRLLIAFAVLFSADFTYQSVEQTHQSHAAVNYYSKNQCTWWAFKRRAQVGKPVSNRWGNAKNWYYNARKSKYATGHWSYTKKICCHAINCRILWTCRSC